MTKLKEIFGTKMAPIATNMGVPVFWLKEDLHSLLSEVSYTATDPTYLISEREALAKVYPTELVDTLLRYRTADDLFKYCAYWSQCAKDYPEEYAVVAKDKQIKEMLNFGKWVNVFALTAWTRGVYKPSKADWANFKRLTR